MKTNLNLSRNLEVLGFTDFSDEDKSDYPFYPTVELATVKTWLCKNFRLKITEDITWDNTLVIAYFNFENLPNQDTHVIRCHGENALLEVLTWTTECLINSGKLLTPERKENNL